MVDKSILLKNLPLELSIEETLRKIGNYIGSYVGIVESDQYFTEKIIVVNMNLNIRKISPIKICCKSTSYTIKPSFIDIFYKH